MEIYRLSDNDLQARVTEILGNIGERVAAMEVSDYIAAYFRDRLEHQDAELKELLTEAEERKRLAIAS
jgi:hypothetical protein